MPWRWASPRPRHGQFCAYFARRRTQPLPPRPLRPCPRHLVHRLLQLPPRCGAIPSTSCTIFPSQVWVGRFQPRSLTPLPLAPISRTTLAHALYLSKLPSSNGITSPHCLFGSACQYGRGWAWRVIQSPMAVGRGPLASLSPPRPRLADHWPLALHPVLFLAANRFDNTLWTNNGRSPCRGSSSLDH